MAQYTYMNPVSSSSALKLKMEDYIVDSLNPVMSPAIWEDFFYKEDIPSSDPRTGKRWVKTFKVSKPETPKGYASYTEEMWGSQASPGYLGLRLPNEEEYEIGTSFKYASAGRTLADKMNDTNNLYEAIKAAGFGPHIREQQIEEVKSAIFMQGMKTYINEKADENAIEATDVLKAANLFAFAEAIETYEVQLIDNAGLAADEFVQAVKAVGGTKHGAEALNNLNVIDFEAFQKAQATFETASLRTYRWATPRFSIAGITAENYESVNVNIEGIKFTPPAMKDLFTKHFKNQDAPLPVLVSKTGYEQLWADEDFRGIVDVSGYRYDKGLSGRFDKFIRKNKAVNVQGLLIINMEQDYIHGSLASEGIDFGKSVNTGGVRLDAALIPTPGYNFITSSSEFGVRTTSKTMEQTDMIDRMGFHEYVYTLFTFKVEIFSPESFNLLIHASK